MIILEFYSAMDDFAPFEIHGFDGCDVTTIFHGTKGEEAKKALREYMFSDVTYLFANQLPNEDGKLEAVVIAEINTEGE